MFNIQVQASARKGSSYFSCMQRVIQKLILDKCVSLGALTRIGTLWQAAGDVIRAVECSWYEASLLAQKWAEIEGV